VFSSSAETPLKFALEKILVTKTHRLWIVDDMEKLEGIVSLTDILRTLTVSPDGDEE
jgi:CBS domain-containing protein